mmetsp:Transcript_21151/g.47724  ORF Transcript_21151/g.47724 Transcript_21151/m.47724 type:complete len:101 (+) Transcript_21151:46-348(+)
MAGQHGQHKPIGSSSTNGRQQQCYLQYTIVVGIVQRLHPSTSLSGPSALTSNLCTPPAPVTASIASITPSQPAEISNVRPANPPLDFTTHFGDRRWKSRS